ncbi:MAG: radical SAM protein [Calditrichia bacterium]
MLRILLVASPVRTLGFDILVRVPNMGLCSIAANLNRKVCDVKVIDLIVAGVHPRDYFKKLLDDYKPDLVGFSCTTFQYKDSLELAKITKSFNKDIKVVFGGYHPSTSYKEIFECSDRNFIDFLIRGEGEIVFNKLVNSIVHEGPFDHIPNISYKNGDAVIHNPEGRLANLGEIKLPDRSTRIINKGFHFFGYPADVVETSRGCVYDCNFCCITSMYGRSFRRHKIERVIEDIRNVKKHGCKAIIISDDNITIDSKRYKEICEAIIEAKLNDLRFFVQVSVKGLKNTPGLIDVMVKAGTKWAFIGIENESDEILKFLNKDRQFRSSDIYSVVRELKRAGIIVLGGIIIGNPNDTEKTIWKNYNFVKKLKIDIPMFMPLTPYPNTLIRDELIKENLVTNLNDYSKYNCYRVNIRTRYISSEKLFILLNRLFAKYPIDSGTIWRLIFRQPLFFVKLIYQQIIRRPKLVFEYILRRPL